MTFDLFSAYLGYLAGTLTWFLMWKEYRDDN